MLHDERRAHLASMISSRLSSEKKIIEPFKNPNKRAVVVSGNNISGTGSSIQAAS